MYWVIMFMVSSIFGTAFLVAFEAISKPKYAIMQECILGNVLFKYMTLLMTSLLCINGISSMYLSSYIEYEPELATLVVSYIFSNGGDMYQNSNEAQIYSVLYGPLMTLPAAYIFKAGGWLTEARFIGFSGVLVFLISTWVFVKRTKLRYEIIMWALVAAYMVMYYSFSTRMDSWLLALPMIAVIGASKNKLWIVAITAGLACNIKLTAVMYFLPIALWVLINEGVKIKKIAISSLLFTLVMYSPFLIQGISIDGYIQWIKAAANHRKMPELFFLNVIVFGMISMPLASILHKAKSNHTKYSKQYLMMIAVVISAMMASYLGSKEGSSYYHIVPMISSLILLFGSRDDWELSFDMRFAMLSFAILAPLTFYMHHQFATIAYSKIAGKEIAKTSESVISEIKQYVTEKGSPASFSMGIGSVNHRQSNAAIHLLHMGGTFVLNEMALWDRHASAIPIPHATVELIDRCQVPYWLIPTGDEPFHSQVIYRRTDYTAEVLRESFSKAYYKEKTGRYFDLWSCKTLK
jgi:hypothetical protein